MVHRGKSLIPTDEEFLRKSLLELLCIFQYVLKNTLENLTFIKVPLMLVKMKSLNNSF